MTMVIRGELISINDLETFAITHQSAVLEDGAMSCIKEGRRVIDRIVESGEPVYGVNTGFGRLSDMRISADKLDALQLNLVRSHACGVGPLLTREEVRAMGLLRLNVFALGRSGCRPETASALVNLLNAGIVPAVPSRGSVGASGDLAPLAHFALALVGEGEAIAPTHRIPMHDALAANGLHPITLRAKEGLALLNGTQAIGAVGGLALARAIRTAQTADVAGAMSLEAVLGTDVAFDERIHDARPHPGQVAVAGHLRDLLAGSPMRESHRENDPRVQDAYCLRCMPQVHGAVRDALEYGRRVFETESASATDNPLVFAQRGDVISGGNFHAAPLAHALDFAAIALTDLASISERRIDRLVNPDLSEGLPPFLAQDPGEMSGLMMPHVTAAALLNEAKVLAHPASVDNVPTSGGKEDHVSMGMTAALKFKRIVEIAEQVLAIEFLCAAQAFEFRRPLRSSSSIEAAYDAIRSVSPALTSDRSTTKDIENVAQLIRNGALNR